MKDSPAPRVAPTPKPAETPTPANYLDLYGLSKPPFGGTPDSGGYILFGAHRRTFELLIEHMVNGSGLLILQGEEGIGKTETLRSAAAVAGESGLQIITLFRPPSGRTTLAQLIAALNGQGAPNDIKALEAVGHFLRPPRKALLIDDFDLLPDDCIKLLWSMLQLMPNDPGGSALVFTTSTDLATETKRPEVSQIAALARNTVRMLPLGAAEIRQYIERSLWVAGGTTRRLVAADAMKILIARSGGVPGVVNRLMEAAFNAGFARGDAMINAKTVAAATGPTASRPRHQETEYSGIAAHAVQIVSIGLLLIGISIFIYQGLKGQHEHPAATAPASLDTPVPSPSVTPVPAGQTRVTKPADALSAALMAALLKRGDQSLELGDIGAARLLFQRAAEAGNAGAATAVGKTYDPNYVAPGSMADPARAAEWYQKAITLGDPHAGELLKRLGTR